MQTPALADQYVLSPLLDRRGALECLRRATWPVGAPTWEATDECAHHVLVLAGGVLVGAARVTIHQQVADLPDYQTLLDPRSLDSALPPVASLNRLVVQPEHRGRGLGRALIAARLAIAHEMKCRAAVAVSRDSHRHSLKRLGFTRVGATRNPPGHFLPGLDGEVFLRILDLR